MRFVIVGGGIAGITAAMDLVRRNLGTVEVYTDEEYPYYYRPQLTEFLAGTITMNELLRRPLSWYQDRGIDIHLGQYVTAIQPEEKSITVNGETTVGYDKLLLAIGSLPSNPPIKGIDKPGVLTWRTLEDTLEMEKAAATCHDTIIIGGGLLGLEASRGLRNFCSRIKVLEYFPRLMPRQLDSQGASLLQEHVESTGVEVIVNAHTQEITGDERVTGVHLERGLDLPAQTIICAAGVRSNTKIAKEAGIDVNRGIIVDDQMTTNHPDIYAAGDVAEYKGYCWAIAPIAQTQARIASSNMAGENTAYDTVVPSTTLKVVGIDVSSIGRVNPESDEFVEIRNLDREAETYKKIVLHNGQIVGAILINAKPMARGIENKISARESMTIDDAKSLIA
jgi:nitrite reductase (NADH) large subunit